ncbi:hypothetical protein ACIHAR_08745 [Streptomyces sp. NPDC052016]|uniref:hypothetical protein n=1 Tax=Streptomyces sp. NPDC052016 TaxID=3365680 RepID=UPI0037D0B462
MGLDITVLGLDWGELERTPTAERQDLLYEAAGPEDSDRHAEPRAGWVFPASPKVPWCGRYEFHSTTGTYKAHFWAGDGWDTARKFADPVLRESLDGFLFHLIWEGDDPPEVVPESGLFPSDSTPWRPSLLLACPPPVVPVIAAHWARAEPLLKGLREEYDRHAGRPGGWIADFDAFTVLLREWAVVVDETARRGWGLPGLPF